MVRTTCYKNQHFAVTVVIGETPTVNYILVTIPLCSPRYALGSTHAYLFFCVGGGMRPVSVRSSSTASVRMTATVPDLLKQTEELKLLSKVSICSLTS